MPSTRKHKVCAECGKSESDNWARHWRTRHAGRKAKELIPGEAPENPYDSSWMYLLKPETLRVEFLRAAQPLALPPKEATTN